MNPFSFLTRIFLLLILVTPFFGNDSCSESDIKEENQDTFEQEGTLPTAPEDLDEQAGGPEVTSPYVE